MDEPQRRRNLIATYASQLYLTLVGIVMLPFYVSALGVERYGIIALAVAFQSWLALLDMGLSQTVTRGAAQYRGGAADGGSLRGLVRFVERFFLVVGVALAAAALFAAPVIARDWLKASDLSAAEMTYAIRLIGLTLMLRFLCIPWRAIQTGSEDFMALAGINVLVTTLRSVAVLAVLAYAGRSLSAFFDWQLAIGVLELALLWLRGRRLLPNDGPAATAFDAIRDHWRFSLGITAATLLWVGVSNADKVILSGLLPLRDYAVFSIATTAANGVMLLVGPFAMGMGPALIRHHAQGDKYGLAASYDRYSQLVAIFAASSALVLALFPWQVLWAWTGKADLAAQGAPVLALYALGNAALAIGALPLQLQAAAGQLRWHVAGSLVFGVVFLPLLVIASRAGGMTGAALTWLGINVVYVGLWLPFLHHRFYPGSHGSWFLRNVLGALAGATGAGLTLKVVLPWPDGRAVTIVQLAVVGAVMLGLSALGLPRHRRQLRSLLSRA